MPAGAAEIMRRGACTNREYKALLGSRKRQDPPASTAPEGEKIKNEVSVYDRRWRQRGPPVRLERGEIRPLLRAPASRVRPLLRRPPGEAEVGDVSELRRAALGRARGLLLPRQARGAAADRRDGAAQRPRLDRPERGGGDLRTGAARTGQP